MVVILSPPRRTKNLSVLVVLALTVAFTAAFAQKQPPAQPLDLNTATVEQLAQLPGVGPVTAQAIFDFRQKSGPFRRVEDLLAIRGITDRRLNELRPYVTVQPAKKGLLYVPHRDILPALFQSRRPMAIKLGRHPSRQRGITHA